MIGFFLHKDPGTLTEQEWADDVSGILYCLQLQRKMLWGDGSKGK